MANLHLSKDPMLPAHPLGQYTDAEFEAEDAINQQLMKQQYADILQKLGYVDPKTGQFIRGSVEIGAEQQRNELNRQMGLAAEQVTGDAQRIGTLFSGKRMIDTERAQHPFVQSLSDLDIQTPLTLASLYETASGLINNDTLQQNKLLADAAARKAAAERSAPASAPPQNTGGGDYTGPPLGATPAPSGSVFPNLPMGGASQPGVAGSLGIPQGVPYTPYVPPKAKKATPPALKPQVIPEAWRAKLVQALF